MQKQDRISLYQDSYLQDYGFESVIVAARQKLVLEVLSQRQPQIVVEIGCGADLLCEKADNLSLPIRKWITVEPSGKFADMAKACKLKLIELIVINNFIEDSSDIIEEICKGPADFIICSSVLHEVPAPDNILSHIKTLLKRGGILHVNVPNANSFHRILAKEMGLIKDEKELSDRNKLLSQFHVFDMNSLKTLIKNAGFSVRDSGGYFVKPFTHKQMEAIKDILSQEMLDGLWLFGKKYPEFASEIYINATIL